MIEGLKVTIGGSELQRLCAARAKHHREREKFYNEKADALKGIDRAEQNSFSNSSVGNPIENMEKSAETHRQSAEELQFTAEHIDIGESYLLARGDLQVIGVVSRGW